MTTERDVLRELETALDVSPSPNFEARVRARVRTQPLGVPLWTWPAGVAVAATVVLAVMLVPGRKSPARSEFAGVEAPAHVASAPEVGSVAESPRPSVEARRTTTDARTRRAVVPVRSDVESPEIVVPAGQMAEIQRLMNEVAAGRVVMGPERPAPPAVLQISALDAAPPIEFDTIKFTPLSADGSPDLWR